MRKLLALTLFTLTACDSSSSSKSDPVTPAPIETTPNGGNAVGATGPNTGEVVGTPTETGEGETPTTTETGTGISSGEGTSPGNESSPLKFGLTTTRIELLNRIGRDLSAKAIEFRSSADTLRDVTAAHCGNPTADSLAAARSAWKSAMGHWQYFEVFQIGPVLENAKDMKYNIYAWPDPANYCSIDGEVLKSAKSASYKLPRNYNRKGLQAVEYMLFDETLNSRCNATSATAVEWNALTATQKSAMRCTYLKALTTEVASQASILETKWGTPDNNFISQSLTDEAKINELIQSLYEASYYVDLEVKNQKIAGPAGIDTRYCDKSPEPCLEKAEFALSGYSREAININMEAFADIFFGSANSGRAGGLSALVRSEGAGTGNAVAERTEQLAAKLVSEAKNETASSLDSLVATFAKENCDISESSWVCKTRNGIRKIFTDLKGEYAAILKVKAPAAAAGDND